MRPEAVHYVTDAACSINEMSKFFVDLLVSSDSVQNVVVDVTENFPLDIYGGLGV